jgi:hypothetical protein
MLTKKNTRLSIFVTIFLCGLLVGCGPSAEEQASTSAALTAAAATNTPTPVPTDTPTPTATPVPYDLSLIVTGEGDIPVIGAVVALVGTEGTSDTQLTDEVGQVFWYDLPGETVDISLSSQGYFPKQVTNTIERGVNQMNVTLERDPHGLLPSEACGPTESLLFIEDFQDEVADRFELITLKIGGWDLGPHPDSMGNVVAMYNGQDGAWLTLHEESFDNAVWRFKVMTDSKRIREYSWLINHYEEGDVETSTYSARFEPGAMAIFRKKWPVSNPDILNRNIVVPPQTWNLIEMSRYDGVFEFWLNGARLLQYKDPEPLPGGTFEIGFEPSPGVESFDFFDNFSVCELTATFEPMPTSGSDG